MVKILQLKDFKKNKLEDKTAIISDLQAHELGLVPSQTIDHSVFSEHEKANSLDWNNQELSDLYRVQQILARAGIHIVTDRGITDENDPWFVFCRSDEDVFIHISRYDGIYLLDSPNIGTPLTGHNFKDLIDEFVRRAVKLQTSENVLPLHAKGKISLHPTLMLTALIWSLYLSADELVGIANAENLTESMLYEAFDAVSTDLDKVEDVDILEEFEPNQDGIFAENSNLNEDALAMQSERTVQNSVVVQNVAAGLATIAATYGFANYVSFVIDAKDNKAEKTEHTSLQSEQTHAFSLDAAVLAELEEKRTIDEVTAEFGQQDIFDGSVKEFAQIFTARLDNIRLDKLGAMGAILGVNSPIVENGTQKIVISDDALINMRQVNTKFAGLDGDVETASTVDDIDNKYSENDKLAVEVDVADKVQFSELDYTVQHTNDMIVFDVPSTDILNKITAGLGQFISEGKLISMRNDFSFLGQKNGLNNLSTVDIQQASIDNTVNFSSEIEKMFDAVTLEFSETSLESFTESVLANNGAVIAVNNTSIQGILFDMTPSDGVDSLSLAQNWEYEDNQGNTQQAVVVTIGSLFDGLDISQDSVDVAGTSNLGVFSADLFATA
jgi:hypothetical protein